MMTPMMKSLLLLVLLAPGTDYPTLVARAAEKQRQHDEELRAAHQALDEGDDGRAVALAGHARLLKREIEALRGEARASLRRHVDALVEQLDHDDYDAREAASRALRELGDVARPELLRRRIGPLPPESRCRIDELLPGLSVDPEGRVRQWASEATASSQYGLEDWSARQMIGPPDSLQAGDARTAWAAKDADAGLEWVRLKFPLALRARKLRIVENDHPGAVVAIDAVGPDGGLHRVWEGVDSGGPAPVAVEIELPGLLTREVVITLDTRKQRGWEEIDAVELVGERADD